MIAMPIATDNRGSLRLSATLLLTGQLLYIVVTLFHTGGEANNHQVVFADYARSGAWTAVHLGQFAAMAIMTAGLFTLSMITCAVAESARWVGRFGAAASVAALALYGVLQAVDGVALKQAVNTWVSAPDAEKAARFASAETVRWLEWGVRSYQNIVMGITLLLVAVDAARTLPVPRALAYLIALSGISFLVQGWLAGMEGFSHAQSLAIITAFILDVIWMTWLLMIVRRLPDSRRATAISS
jgi:hypothetical protein